MIFGKGRRKTRLISIALIGILVLGGFLRFYRIDQKNFWWDEILTITIPAAPKFQNERLPVEVLIPVAPQIDPRLSFSKTRHWIEALWETPHPPPSFFLHPALASPRRRSG